MTDATMPVAEPQAATNWWNWGGTALILAGFAVPALMAAGEGAGAVGTALGRATSNLLVLAFLAWLVVRKKGALSQAKARGAVGILLCLSGIASVSIELREREELRTFMAQAMALEQRYAPRFADLDKRFNAIDFNAFLTPEGITKAETLAAGEAASQRYRALLEERRELVKTYAAEAERNAHVIASDDVRHGVQKGMRTSRDKIDEVQRLLDTTQTEQAAAIEALLQWARANQGRLQAQGGRLVFQEPVQQQQFSQIVARLSAADKVVEAAGRKADEAVAAARVRREEGLQRVQSLLKN